ncbi:pyridoxal reductase [Atractiella rhizophila]|nr:pyridoxal reductase [Atractiella rhizophila]
MSSKLTITDGKKSFEVGRLGYGLMNFTWTPNPKSDEQAFPAIKAAIDGGCNLLNSAEFYGNAPNQTANLTLLSRFFKKYPEYSEKTFLSVKGGININTLAPDQSTEGLRRSVDNTLAALAGTKKLDLFECARVDKSPQIEDVIGDLKTLIDEGKFDFIGLSECSAETIRRAHKVHPIAMVEVEYSPWALDIEHNGVLAACKELGIAIAAYSPLGRGFLTGTLRSIDDIPEGDLRRHLDRFQPENFGHNLKLVDEIAVIANEKGLTNAQLCLAWEMNQYDKLVPIPGSTRVDGVQESAKALQIKLTEAELKEVRAIVQKADVKGGRYNDRVKHTLEG